MADGTLLDREAAASHDITVRATDAGGLWVESTFTVTVNPVNDAPTTAPVTLAPIAEDSGARTIIQADLLANAGDIEGDSLTATSLAISAGAGTLIDNGDGTYATSYTPATPGPYELEKADAVVEQIIRPTGLIDPKVEVRAAAGQVDALAQSVGELVLVAAGDIANYFNPLPVFQELNSLPVPVLAVRGNTDPRSANRILKD